MKITKPSQLLSLSLETRLTKENLYQLIQYSKIEESPFWESEEYIIGNTPQQGINWIGKIPYLKGVIIKTREGAYEQDGWENKEKLSYRYSFKFRKGKLNLKEIANDVLVKQAIYNYPILLFIEQGKEWEYQGQFYINKIGDGFVSLEKSKNLNASTETSFEDVLYLEGDKKYVSHLIAERNKIVVKVVKSAQKWICDICGCIFMEKYGVNYIEAHHKKPISSFTNENTVGIKDFVLLCPNCHKAVHIHMKMTGKDYETIKDSIKSIVVD